MYGKINNGEMKFNPLSSRLGISGTSYIIQLGKINDKWASILLHGEKCIASNIYQKDDEKIPNIRQIINWALSTIPIPNVNPRQVSTTISLLAKQAIENDEKKREIISIKETESVELKHIENNKQILNKYCSLY